MQRRVLALIMLCITLPSLAGDGKRPVAPSAHDAGMATGHKIDPNVPAYPKEALACTALGDVIRANDGKMPLDFKDWVRVLREKSNGHLAPVFVPFSRSINPGDLGHVRTAVGISPVFDNGEETQKPGKLNLTGKLYIAKAFTKDGRVVLEFISKNKRTHEFDFGIIENFEDPRKRHVIFMPKNQCLPCHPAGGPILTNVAWSDTTAVYHTFRAFVHKLAEKDKTKYKPLADEVERIFKKYDEDKKKDDDLKPDDLLRKSPIVMSARYEDLPIFPGYFLDDDAAALDRIIGHANGTLFLRDCLDKLEAKRKAKVNSDIVEGIALRELVSKEAAEPLADRLRKHLDATDADVETAATERRFHLNDYDASGVPMEGTKSVFLHDPSTLQAVLDYDERRKKGKEPTPEEAIPTAQSAFDLTTAPFTTEWQEANDEPIEHFETLVGLHPAQFIELKQALAAAIDRIPAAKRGKKTKAQLLDELVRAALKADKVRALTAGSQPPGADLILYQLAAALDQALKPYGIDDFRAHLPEALRTAPDCHESIPKPVAKSKGQEKRCAECHDGADTIGGPVPNPPRPGFDPANKADWEKWLGEPTKADALKWMRKVRRRVQTGSMPPKNSTQFKGFEGERKKLLEYFDKTLQ